MMNDMLVFVRGSAANLLADMFYDNSVDEMVPLTRIVRKTLEQALEEGVIQFHEIEQAEQMLWDMV